MAAHHGHRVLFATAVDWVARLTEAHRLGRLPAEFARLRHYGLIIIDEAGYLRFEQDAANLAFQLVSSPYELASLILTSNLPLSGWGGVFGDQGRRRRHDRPDRPPRRRPDPQRSQLPAPQPGHRHPPQHPNRVRHLNCTTTYTAHLSTGKSAQFSTGVDTDGGQGEGPDPT